MPSRAAGVSASGGPLPEGGYFVTSWISHWPSIETSTITTSPASYTRSTRNEYRNISQHIAAVTIAVTRYRIKAQFFMFILLPVRDSLLYPFDIVDIIKIIFHRVAGFEGLRTYRRISGQTSTPSTPQRGARLNIQQWFRRYFSPLLPLGELRRGKHYFRYIAVVHQCTTAVTVLMPAGCPI